MTPCHMMKLLFFSHVIIHVVSHNVSKSCVHNLLRTSILFLYFGNQLFYVVQQEQTYWISTRL
jgi:hypothetical protein